MPYRRYTEQDNFIFKDIMDTIKSIVAQALSEWKAEGGDELCAWAGECGTFLEFMIKIAEEQGVAYQVGNAYGGKLELITNDVSSALPLIAPPGMTLADSEQQGILANLDHIWLVKDGRHYDGAHPDGVDTPFELRLFRQVAVEILRRNSAPLLEQLVAEHAYWRESVELFDAYLAAKT